MVSFDLKLCILLALACPTDAFLAPQVSSKAKVLSDFVLYLTSSTESNNDSSETQRLLEKAAKLRAEIAEMEGKTLEQVETEALKKKESKMQRRKKNELQDAERKSNSVERRVETY
jgi:hypothetical protein